MSGHYGIHTDPHRMKSAWPSVYRSKRAAFLYQTYCPRLLSCTPTRWPLPARVASGQPKTYRRRRAAFRSRTNCPTRLGYIPTLLQPPVRCYNLPTEFSYIISAPRGKWVQGSVSVGMWVATIWWGCEWQRY